MGTLSKWLHSEPRGIPAPVLTFEAIDELRRLSLAVIADCPPPHDARARRQVENAITAQQLWMARCEMYQLVARRHCEAEAARRIEALAPAFEAWLPQATLRRR